MDKVAIPKKTLPPRIRIFRFSENFSMEHRSLYTMLQEIVTVCSGYGSPGLCLRYVLLTPTLPIYPPSHFTKTKYIPCVFGQLPIRCPEPLIPAYPAFQMIQSIPWHATLYRLLQGIFFCVSVHLKTEPQIASFISYRTYVLPR